MKYRNTKNYKSKRIKKSLRKKNKNTSATRNKRRTINKRRRSTKGGAYICPQHPGKFTSGQLSSNTMTRPVAYHGEMADAINNPTYWSNFGQLGENTFGTLN